MVQLASSTGAVTKDYDYDAFGVERNALATDANPFRYCGEQFDGETGNYYLRVRYYSPEVGRFTQEDPARDGTNWYSYCDSNPVTFFDPWGLVKVGLRDYATTYRNSAVDWDGKTGTATVTWGGKTLSVKATAENTQNGRIYIDDSVFVKVFGIGTKLMVYQDKVTNNVSIRGSFDYRGRDAYTSIAGTKKTSNLAGVSYSETFLQAIEEYWSGDFGEYEVSTYARYHGDGIKVSFNNKLGISHMTPGLFGWAKSRPGRLTVFTGDSRGNGDSYSFGQFAWTSAHEFGHILGVGDAYNSKQSIEVRSIYNGFGTNVQEGDIAMVLRAWSTGLWQNWQ